MVHSPATESGVIVSEGGAPGHTLHLHNNNDTNNLLSFRDYKPNSQNSYNYYTSAVEQDYFAERRGEILTTYALDVDKTRLSCQGNFPSFLFVTSAILGFEALN